MLTYHTVQHAKDVRHFDGEFTSDEPIITPCDEEILDDLDQVGCRDTLWLADGCARMCSKTFLMSQTFNGAAERCRFMDFTKIMPFPRSSNRGPPCLVIRIWLRIRVQLDRNFICSNRARTYSNKNNSTPCQTLVTQFTGQTWYPLSYFPSQAAEG